MDNGPRASNTGLFINPDKVTEQQRSSMWRAINHDPMAQLPSKKKKAMQSVNVPRVIPRGEIMGDLHEEEIKAVISPRNAVINQPNFIDVATTT